jgi:hypothetical protein
MKMTKTIKIVAAIAALTTLTISLQAFRPTSKTSRNPAAGINGSFEITNTKSGLPANWSFYTPKTAGAYAIVLDKTDPHEGNQSLQLLVRTPTMPGQRPPGFFKEFPDTKPGETYKITFWAKNVGSEFAFTARGVSAFGGEQGVQIKSKETIQEWRRFEITHTIPPKMRLRLELDILQPGDFWIDDLQITKSTD